MSSLLGTPFSPNMAISRAPAIGRFESWATMRTCTSTPPRSTSRRGSSPASAWVNSVG
jgi:hypothetical protein